MVSTRLTTLATLGLAVGVLAGAVSCSSGEEVTSTAGPPGSGTTVLRFAGTVIVAEPAGSKAAVGVGALIGPPPTPSTTTTAAPTTTAPPTTLPPVTQAPITIAPTTAPPQTTPQTVTFTIPPTTFPGQVTTPTTAAKNPPTPLGVGSISPDEQQVYNALVQARGGGLTLETAATQAARTTALKIAQTNAPQQVPQPLFNFVDASYSQLTAGTIGATDIAALAKAAAQQLGPSLAGFQYVGLAVATATQGSSSIMYVVVILGS